MVKKWILIGKGQYRTFVFLLLHIHQSKKNKEEEKKIVYQIVCLNHQRVLIDVSRNSLYRAFLSWASNLATRSSYDGPKKKFPRLQ